MYTTNMTILIQLARLGISSKAARPISLLKTSYMSNPYLPDEMGRLKYTWPIPVELVVP